MNSLSPSDDAAPIRVGIADYGVSDCAPIATSGLGSCLGVALYDSSSNLGGLLHPMLPYRPEGDDRSPATYVDSGIAAILDTMERQGAARPRIVAKLAGGAAVLELTANEPIGTRNIEAARSILNRIGIEIVDEDVGGSCGRTVTLDPHTGEFEVKRANGDVTFL